MLLAFAETHHAVTFLPCSRCAPSLEETAGEQAAVWRRELDGWARLCFAWHSEAEIVEGARRLGAAVRGLTARRAASR